MQKLTNTNSKFFEFGVLEAAADLGKEGFTSNSCSISKIFSNFKNVTVNFKYFLQISVGGTPLAPPGSVHLQSLQVRLGLLVPVNDLKFLKWFRKFFWDSTISHFNHTSTDNIEN
jgi:hypothetical protein